MNNLQNVAENKSQEVKVKSVAELVQTPRTRKYFEDVLGKKAAQFLASVAGAVNVNPALQQCEPKSVMASAMVAATLDLEVVPSFGFAALVPYNTSVKVENPDKSVSWVKVNKAQFQIMTKGMVQLALRSGQFKSLNVGRLYKDEIIGYDPIKGKFEINKQSEMRKVGKDEDVAGYFCYFELTNGFEKTEFWTIDEIVAHGQKYSKNFNNQTSLWHTNFEAMAQKTVLKNTLSKYAPLSTQMRNAIVADQATFDDIESAQNFDGDYVDSPISDDKTLQESEPAQAPIPDIDVKVKTKAKSKAVEAQVEIVQRESEIADEPKPTGDKLVEVSSTSFRTEEDIF